MQGGPWRKKATELDGTEDEKELPWWCIDCVLHGRLSQRENAKYVKSYASDSSWILNDFEVFSFFLVVLIYMDWFLRFWPFFLALSCRGTIFL